MFLTFSEIHNCLGRQCSKLCCEKCTYVVKAVSMDRVHTVPESLECSPTIGVELTAQRRTTRGSEAINRDLIHRVVASFFFCKGRLSSICGHILIPSKLFKLAPFPSEVAWILRKHSNARQSYTYRNKAIHPNHPEVASVVQWIYPLLLPALYSTGMTRNEG